MTEAKVRPGLNKAQLAQAQTILQEVEIIANDLITSGAGYPEEVALVVDIKRACARAAKILDKNFMLA